MYMLQSNPPSPSWRKSGDSKRLPSQSRDGHVTTSQLPISPVRVERYLKPKQATQAVVVTAPSPRKERKLATSATKASADQPVDTTIPAEEPGSLRFSQLERRAFATMPQMEISAQPLSVDLSRHSQNNISLPGASDTQLYTNRRKVARLLTFSDSSPRNVDDTPLPQGEDSPLMLYSVDSLELSDTTSMTSTEMNRSSVISPRFYDGLPITLEELLSSSSDASASASPQQGEDGPGTPHLQGNPFVQVSAPLLSFTSPSSVSRRQKDKLEAYPHPLPPSSSIPLTPHGADTVVRPRSSPVLSYHSDYISSQATHGTPAIRLLRATNGVHGKTDLGTTHRPHLLQPGPSSPHVAMATNTRVQPVAMPPPNTALVHPNGFPSSGPDTKTLRAVNFRKLRLLKKVLSLWRAGVAVKRDQADLVRRKMLLRRGMKALWHNYRVAVETNKMAVWRLHQEKARRYLYKWKMATKMRQMSALRHFFLLWKCMWQLQAAEHMLTEAKNHALLSARFLQWRGTFRFSLMEISASQFWRARIVRECFTEWRIRRVQRQSCAYAEEVVMATHQSAMKRQAFQEWRIASDVRRQENAAAQMELLQEAFTYWRSLAFDLGENKPGAVQSATGLRNRALLSKGFRKWLLKYRGQCFERKRGVGLLARVFVVWYQVVGQRGRDMLSATAFNQQALVRCCWAEMKQRCAAKCRREKVAVLRRQRTLLQRCFLGWRRYMYQATLRCVCEQFVEQKRCKQLQACFDHWVLAICQRQHEGTLSVCASWASEQASLRRAFTAWVAVWKCAGAQKKVQGWTGRHMMQICFNCWCAALKRRRTLHQLVTSKTQSIEESTFRQWRERVCRNEAERTARRHQRLCTLKRSFAVWKGEYLKVHLSLTHGALYLKSLTSRCLHVWRERTAVRGRLGATLERVLKELELRKKREVFVVWRRKAGRIKAVRLLSGLLTENLLRTCLQAWHNHTACSMSELEASFLTHLHQAILLESHRSISTPATISSVTPSHTALPLGQSCISSAANSISPAPMVETVKRNLFQGTSLPSLFLAVSGYNMTSLKSASAPMEDITTGRAMNTPRCRLSGATGFDTREVGPSHESGVVVAMPSPTSKIRILEESPSPPTAEGSARGTPLHLKPGRVSELTVGYDTGDVSEPYDAVSLTPDSLEEDASFLSVNLCPCVSDEVRAQLHELDSALPLDSSCLDVSDDGSLDGMQPMWTEQELEPALLARQPTEANAVALSNVAGVLPAPGTHTSPPSLPSMAQGLVSANVPKDSAVVSRLLRILHCWRMYPCGKVFHQWHCYTVWRKRLRGAYDTTSKHHRAGILREYLGAWRKHVQTCATLVNRCEALSVSCAQRQLYVKFAYWRRHTERILDRSTALGRVAEVHHACTLMRQGLHKWIKEAVRRKHDKISLYKLNLWRTRVAFAVWRQSAVARSVMTKQTMQAADMLARRIALARGLAQWTERLQTLKRTSETATGVFQKQQNMTLLSRSYHHWQERCALYRKQDSSAHILQIRHTLHRSVSTWRRHCITRTNREKDRIVAADCFTVKSAMERWKRHLDARIRTSVLAGQHRARVVLRASFHHWREETSSSLSRRKMGATTAEEFYQRSTKSRYLRQWRKYLILQEARRQEQCRLLLKRQRGSSLHRSFRTWKHQLLLVQGMHQLRAAQSRSVIVHCWGRWKDCALADHTANKQHSTTVLLRSWKRWRISFIEQRTANEVVAAANKRRAQQILKAWMSVTSPVSVLAPAPLCDNNIVSLHSVPPLLGVSTQSASRELMGHIFNLWKYQTKLCTETPTL